MVPLLLLGYIVSMIWINFHSALWYQMDCYSYAYEGKLMFGSRSLFPPDWIFSNQYHIISPPNIAALFYGFTHDSISAMSFATSFSIFAVIASFLWCFYPFLKKRSVMPGVLCLIGGVILGTNAAMYISGLQVLYTMCGFYACYLIGILLTLGIWLRLHTSKRVHPLFIVFVLLLNFALGMQSLREMLILVIPLLLTETITSIFLTRKKGIPFRLTTSSSLFVLSVFITEFVGHLYMDALNIPSTPNIGNLELDISPMHLFANFWASTKNLLRISGIAIVKDHIKYLPLSFCAICIVMVIIYALVLIVQRKDGSPLAMAIFFSLLSVLCVYGIGIFLMRTRDIYYFVYWLLASLCFVYLLNDESIRYHHTVFTVMIAICCVNYCFNFLPNFIDYNNNHKDLETFTDYLSDQGVQVIYTDAMPVIAAASHDKIVSQSFWLDLEIKSGFPLNVSPSDKHTVIFDDTHYDGSLICFSNYSYEALTHAPDSYRHALFDNMVYFDRFSLRGNSFILYKPLKRVIAPISFYAE